MTTDGNKYDVYVRYLDNSGNPCGDDRWSLNATTLDDAIDEAQTALDNECAESDEEGEIVYDIRDDDNESVHVLSQQYSQALREQQDMTVLATYRGEFETEFLGHRGSRNTVEFARWRTNGGYRGAHDRTCGDGRWRESYSEPEIISAGEAVVSLVKDFVWTVASAARAVARAGASDRDEIVEALIDNVAGIDSPADAARAMPGVRF